MWISCTAIVCRRDKGFQGLEPVSSVTNTEVVSGLTLPAYPERTISDGLVQDQATPIAFR
jgi:hypothetical protein